MIRGYTGHEHLDEFGLINMNGRLYEPVLGRFLQTDPVVQDPFDLQNMNRYSYALNNPLKFIDPSGYNWGPSAQNSYYNSVYVGSGTSIIGADGISYYNTGVYNDPTLGETNSEGPGIFVGNNPASSANPAGPSKSFGVLKTGGAGNGSPGTNPAAKQTINPYQVFKIQYSSSASGSTEAITNNKNISNSTQSNSGVGDWFKDHFYTGASYEYSFGFQVAGELKKGIGVTINPYSYVLAEATVDNRNGLVSKTYIMGDKISTEFSASYNGYGIGYKQQHEKYNSQNKIHTISAGALIILGADISFDNNGNVTDWFFGLNLSGKVAAGFGMSGEIKTGFKKK